MIKDCFYRIIYSLFSFIYICNRRLLGNKQSLNEWILKCNNKIILKKIKKIKTDKILILLPHCVQASNCSIRVTNFLENCIKCGNCKIGDIKELGTVYQKISIKIATGGTLARRYIKEEKPNFIIAIACDRDLMSGIFDAYPFHVYGIFNKIIKKECQGTDFSVEEIKKTLEDIGFF